MFSRISNHFRVTVGASVVALLCLFFNNLAHAQKWTERITTNGCVIYEWEEKLEPGYRTLPETYSWSGKCKRGAPISGRGTLTAKSESQTRKITGEYKNGVQHGDFLYTLSDLPNEELRLTFVMGCLQKEGRTIADCVPRDEGSAKLDKLSNQQSPSSPSNQQSQSSQSQKTQGGKDNPEAQAHECIAIDQTSAGSFGGFKNSCNYKVDFSTCNYKPRITQGGFNWSADFDCEKGEFGLHTPGGGASVAAHNKNTEQVHWFACKAPASPTDIKFIVGKGLEGRCVNY